MSKIVLRARASPPQVRAGGVLLFQGDASPESVTSVRLATRLRRSQADHDVPSSDRRHVLISVLKDESGANAFEYALIMALAAVFIIGGLLTLSSAIREPLTDTAACLADPANCADIVLAGDIDEQGGESGGDGGNSVSGLADETNPGAGGGRANSPNPGLNNPGGKEAGEGNAKGGGKGNAKGGGKGNAKGGGKGNAKGGGQGLGQGGGQGGG